MEQTYVPSDDPEYAPADVEEPVVTAPKIRFGDFSDDDGDLPAATAQKKVAKKTKTKRDPAWHSGGPADKPVDDPKKESSRSSQAKDDKPATQVANVPERGGSPAPESNFGFFWDVLDFLSENKRIWAYALPDFVCGPNAGIHVCDAGGINTLPFSFGGDADCEHTAIGCDCVDPKYPGLLFGSVHALTVLELRDLLDLHPELYVVAWKFGADGAICGKYRDVSYYLKATATLPLVHIRRKYETMVYEGDYYPHTWLFSGHLEGVPDMSGRDLQLMAKLVMSDEESGMTLFKLTKRLARVDVLSCAKTQGSWQSAIAGSDNILDVTIPRGNESYTGALEFGAMRVARLHNFFGILVAWDQQDRPIIVSRAIVGKAARGVLAVSRDEISYRSTVIKVTREYDKLDNLPEDLKALAIPMTTALAFTLTMESEIQVKTRMLKDWGSMFDQFEQLRKFRVPYDLGLTLKLTTCTLSVLYVAWKVGIVQPGAPIAHLGVRLHTLRDKMFYKIGDDLTPPSDVQWFLRPYFGLVRPWTPAEPRITQVCDIPAVRDPPLGLIVATSPEREPESAVQLLKTGFYGLLATVASTRFGGKWLTSLWTSESALQPTSRVTPLPPGSACLFTEACAAPKYAYDAVKNPIQQVSEDVVKLEDPALLVCGIAFSQKVPFHFKAKSQIVERNMLENRCLLERPEVDVDLYNEMHAKFEREPIMQRVIGTPCIVDYDRWVEHFPSATKRQVMRSALESLLVEPINLNDCVRSIFVKIEKSGFVFPWGMELAAPRHIVGGKPRYLAATGPFIWAMGNRVKDCFGETDEAYYGARTAESCGRALMSQIQAMGGLRNVFFLKGDASRMDAHVHSETLKKEYRLAKQMGAPALCLAAIRLQRAVCYTVGGLRLVIEGRRVTGDARTSVGNTLEMAFICWACMMLTLPHIIFGLDWREMLNGDDSVLVVDKRHYSPDLPDRLNAQALRLGYRMKFELAMYLEDVEFCSRIFWPTADGYVLGAKIGRWLAKAGYMFRSANTMADYRSQMIGHLQDNWFVPLVSDYCRCVIELIPKSNRRYRAKGREGREEDYKIHAEKVHEPCTDTFVFAHLRYGLTRAHIEEFRACLREVHTLPVMLHLEWLDDIMEVDA